MASNLPQLETHSAAGYDGAVAFARTFARFEITEKIMSGGVFTWEVKAKKWSAHAGASGGKEMRIFLQRNDEPFKPLYPQRREPIVGDKVNAFLWEMRHKTALWVELYVITLPFGDKQYKVLMVCDDFGSIVWDYPRFS